jgi:hypothetical protein
VEHADLPCILRTWGVLPAASLDAEISGTMLLGHGLLHNNSPGFCAAQGAICEPGLLFFPDSSQRGAPRRARLRRQPAPERNQMSALGRLTLLLLGVGALGAGGGCGGGDSSDPAPPQGYTVGGPVSGLITSGLVLANGRDA